MRKKNLIYSCAFLALSLYSCSSEEEIQEGVGNVDNKDLPAVMLIAGFGDESNTRTTAGSDGIVKWTVAKDKIAVNGFGTGYTSDGAMLINGDATKASFMVNAHSPYSCVYPSEVATGYNSGAFTLNMPETMQYNQDETALFSDGQNVSIAYNTGENLYFQNTCGILKITIRNSSLTDFVKVKSIRLTTNSAKLSGNFNVTPANGPALSPQQDAKSTKSIVFDTPRDIPKGEDLNLTYVLPPFTETQKWILDVIDVDGQQIGCFVSESVLIVPRSKITTYAAVAHTLSRVEMHKFGAIKGKPGEVNNTEVPNKIKTLTERELKMAIDNGILRVSNAPKVYDSNYNETTSGYLLNIISDMEREPDQGVRYDVTTATWGDVDMTTGEWVFIPNQTCRNAQGIPFSGPLSTPACQYPYPWGFNWPFLVLDNDETFWEFWSSRHANYGIGAEYPGMIFL